MLMITLALTTLALQDTEGWRYVVPPDGNALRRPQPRALPLGNEVPEGVQVTAEFKSDWQRYGMLRYGDPDSTRVAIAVDHLSPTRIELYVDIGRDLTIGDEDRVKGVDGRFEFSLPVATRDAQGHDVLVPRRVVLELGPTGTILGVATLGWLEGEVTIGERSMRALRRDGDANGFFGDARDQVWLDRDGSGDFAPLEELFVVQPILLLDGERYALRSDRLGSDLRFDRLEGAGRVTLAIPGPKGEARSDIVDLAALFVGRDGSAVLARAPGAATELPIGEYRLSMVTLRIADPLERDPWSFIFSERGSAGEANWRTIEKDAELVVDPIGELQFGVELLSSPTDIEAGGVITTRLTLHTEDRLLINTAYRGREAPAYYSGTLSAIIELLDEDGRVIGTGSSGFA